MPLESYSEYHRAVAAWWRDRMPGETWSNCATGPGTFCARMPRLQKIVKLIGEDSLPDEQRMVVMAARLIKEGFLQQNAFDAIDMFALPKKQLKMLKAILRFCDMGMVLVRKGIPAFRLRELGAFGELQRMKETIPNAEAGRIDELIRTMEEEMYRQFPIAEREFFGEAALPHGSEGEAE